MKLVKGNITAPKGFYALGKHIGIKKKRKDFAVIYSSKICSAAAVYTKNTVKGAPLIVTKKHLKNGKAQAVVINSGVANVCTGKKGIKDAEDMAKLAAEQLNISKSNVLVASTGLIGAFIPMGKIKNGVKNIKSQLKKKNSASEAILTTDTIKKEIAVKIGNITIGAIAKGAGMIHPNMATMLAFIATDADFSAAELRQMLKKAVDKSFNMTSVDYDTSTSDMAILMANGLAGKINAGKFQKALDFICIELAKKIAKSVISSNLVKAAIFGSDPNWGRIMSAMGNSDAYFKEGKVDIFISNKKIVGNGIGAEFDKAKLIKLLKNRIIRIMIDLDIGKKSATAYGCDLTYDYVKINAKYTT